MDTADKKKYTCAECMIKHNILLVVKTSVRVVAHGGTEDWNAATLVVDLNQSITSNGFFFDIFNHGELT